MSPEEILSQSNIIDEEKFRNLIKSREIKPEDFYILEQLAGFHKHWLIADFHNFFNSNRERSEKELEKQINYCRQRLGEISDEEVKKVWEDRLKMSELFLIFVKKYNWAIAWNLERVLEDI